LSDIRGIDPESKKQISDSTQEASSFDLSITSKSVFSRTTFQIHNGYLNYP